MTVFRYRFLVLGVVLAAIVGQVAYGYSTATSHIDLSGGAIADWPQYGRNQGLLTYPWVRFSVSERSGIWTATPAGQHLTGLSWPSSAQTTCRTTRDQSLSELKPARPRRGPIPSGLSGIASARVRRTRGVSANCAPFRDPLDRQRGARTIGGERRTAAELSSAHPRIEQKSPKSGGDQVYPAGPDRPRQRRVPEEGLGVSHR